MNSLATYLRDHLAGATFAIDLLKAMEDRRIEGRGAQFISPLLVEIQQDRDTLQSFAETVGPGSSVMKEAAAWVSEKASRAKLGSGAAGIFREFEALEFLALGIQGKLSLWLALQAASGSDARLRGLDLDQLIVRAHSQYEQVEMRRIELAAIALAPDE